MKTSKFLMVLALFLLTLSMANAKSNGSVWGYGLEGGIAIGDNASPNEDISPLMRGFVQLDMSKQLITRFGISYLPIGADDIYSTQTVMGDVRLLFRPIQFQYLSPYLYAGVGGTKDVKYSSSKVLLAIPFGVGFQTQLSPKLHLEINGGYTLSMSDDLDKIARLDDDLNRISNKKHDGFFTIAAGLAFTNPHQAKEPKEVVVIVVPEKKPEIDPKSIDTDGDGLTDVEEAKYGTDPNKKDTDGDGLSDYDEIFKYRTNPLVADTDGDGLSDGDEVLKYRTDPLKADTDGDGLSDYDEVFKYRTDPLKADTDGGGMTDGAEVRVGKNPLDPLDDVKDKEEPKKIETIVVPEPKPDMSKVDTDGDGLTDIEEAKYGTNPNNKDTDGDGLSDGDEVHKYRTNPLVVDTDGDGLSDGDEVLKYGTDPLKKDTDGDGLSDYDEVMVHKTDPLKIDTDGGGMNDGAEIKAGKNPLDPKDDLLDLSKGKKMVLDGITFETAKSTIRPDSRTILGIVYESLEANPDVSVIISGHTDSVGDDDSNRALSLRRAQAVKDWLVAKGVSSSRIKVIGKGEAEPIASNDTADGRAKNRRIEFEVEK